MFDDAQMKSSNGEIISQNPRMEEVFPYAISSLSPPFRRKRVASNLQSTQKLQFYLRQFGRLLRTLGSHHHIASC